MTPWACLTGRGRTVARSGGSPLIHLTTGQPYTSTGRCVAAVCGRQVRPDRVELAPGDRVCRECAR